MSSDSEERQNSISQDGDNSQQEIETCPPSGIELLEHISDGVVCLDRNLRYIYINHAADRLFSSVRKTRETIIGQKLIDAFPNVVGTPFFEACQIALTERNFTRLDHYSPNLEAWYDCRFHPSEEGITILFLEITERKEAQQTLQETEEQLRLAVEAANIGTWNFYPETGALEWSDRCKAFFGLASDAEVSYESFLNGMHPEDRERMHQAVQEVLNPEGPGELNDQYRTIGPDGTERWLIAQGRAFFEGQGKLRRAVRFTGIVQDVTERKKEEETKRINDARFRMFYESNLIGMAIWNTDGDILEGNDAYLRVLGFSREEFKELGKVSWLERTPPEYRGADDDAIQRARDRGFSGIYEKEYVHRDGARMAIMQGMSFAHDSDQHGIVFTLDNTERKRAEEALKEADRQKGESLALLDSLLANAPIGFAFFDREYRFVRLNPFLAEINSIPVEEHLGRSVRELLPVNARSVEPVLERVFATGEPVLNLEISGETPAKPGVFRHWLTGFYPIRTPEGEFPWVGAVVMEITGQKVLEAELHQKASALIEADRRKDEFLAMLGHELRNPLAPMRNAVAIMKLRGLDDPLLQRARDVLDRQMGQMMRLVDDLLDVSRIARGKIVLQLAPTELASILQCAVETSLPFIEEREQQLNVSLPPEPIQLMADATRMEQVLTNLLNNAAKFTEPGGEITLSAERDGDEAVISVRDTGKGIPKEMLPHVFDLFTQVSPTLDRSQGGLGLGLTLVKRLVTKHGGQVRAFSEGPGRGSEFMIRLPVLKEDSNSQRDDGFGGESLEGQPRLLRILIVDDNRDAADSLADVMAVWGHDTCTTTDGLSALEVSADFKPDVILLDIGLPGLDGYEVARRLRKVTAFQPGLLLALTGYGQEADRKRSEEAGFDEHLVKPVDLARLQELFTRLLTTDKGGSSVGHTGG